ncbi:hypothetical protein OEZ85_011749 [Tetradesmus obliquus]|uniref:Inositol oxygenase n=1 Tax=Tetradesmus obliquus TaxID=3088 RepID=A0ABY8TTP1_TETOB|nr:hypothetical protein OEZ85_011749 [Tetradesmus obliquus]
MRRCYSYCDLASVRHLEAGRPEHARCDSSSDRGGIQSQKAAGFQAPVAAAGGGAAQGGSGVAAGYGHLRGFVTIGSVDSVDSITSVEAGEHFMRMGGTWRQQQQHVGQQPAAQQSDGAGNNLYGAASSGVPGWSFSRRPASFDCARPGGGSSRRRGSLEMNMPWRAKLDAVIAQVASEALDSGTPPAGSPHSLRSMATEVSEEEGGSRQGSGTLMMEQVEPFSVEAGDPFETDAMASALQVNRAGSGWNAQPGHALLRQQHPSGLDLLLPLPENVAQADSSGPVVGLADLGHARGSSQGSGSSLQQQAQAQRHTEQQDQVVVVLEVEEEDDDEDEAAYLKQLSGGRSGLSSIADSAIGADTGALSPTAAHQQQQGAAAGAISLMSASSIASSVSSISSRGAGNASFYARRGAGSGSSGAAYELFVRLNRARQTLDYAKRQAQLLAELDRAELGVWEALDLLNSMREYEAVLLAGSSSVRSSSGGGGAADAAGQQQQQQLGCFGAPLVSQGSISEEPLTPDMPLKEHALQVAELCRLSFPDKPWMALAGLLHGLGKLLAHPGWGGQPQWAVAGESYPVGCKFAPQISHSEFFSANPDRRRRSLSTPLGIYTPGCGLRNVYMSWGAPEYLYMALVLNQTQLPEEALFMLRYQRCAAITKPGGAYRHLMSEADKALLPLLAAFQSLTAYRRVVLPPEALQGERLVQYYDELIARYLGEEKLFW